MVLLLYIYSLITAQVCFGEKKQSNVLDLNLEIPSTNVAAIESETRFSKLKSALTKQSAATHGAATIVKSFMPILPATMVDGVVRKINSVATRFIENVNTTEYQTFWGSPCNPNETSRCFLRSTTTTTPKPGKFKDFLSESRRQQEGRQHKRKPSKTNVRKSNYSDFDFGPTYDLDISDAANRANAILEKPGQIAAELKQEQQERDFFTRWQEDIGDSENENATSSTVNPQSSELKSSIFFFSNALDEEKLEKQLIDIIPWYQRSNKLDLKSKSYSNRGNDIIPEGTVKDWENILLVSTAPKLNASYAINV